MESKMKVQFITTTTATDLEKDFRAWESSRDVEIQDVKVVSQHSLIVLYRDYEN
jgi:hypothetical protein